MQFARAVIARDGERADEARAIFYSDGGDKRLAALNPIYGRDKIVRSLDGVTKKFSV